MSQPKQPQWMMPGRSCEMFEDDGMPNKFLVEPLIDTQATIISLRAQLEASEAQLRQEREARESHECGDTCDALQAQVAQLQAAIRQLEWCAIRSSESESTGTIHRYYCCPVCNGDKRWGKHLDGCSLSAALATCPAPAKEGE